MSDVVARDYAAALAFAQKARASGKSYNAIAMALMNAGYVTSRGKRVWNVGTVYQMVRRVEVARGWEIEGPGPESPDKCRICEGHGTWRRNGTEDWHRCLSCRGTGRRLLG